MDEIGHGRDREKQWKGCIPFVAIGCGVLVFLALIAVGFVVLKSNATSDGGFLGSLAELFGVATLDRGAMARLKEDLASRYPAEDIGVRARTRAVVGSDKASVSLDVEFLNPRFVTALEEPQGEQVAHDIAIHVATTYPNVERFDIISVTLLSKSGTGITLGASATYRFEVSELVRAVEAPQ